MKQLILISTLVLCAFSCKKEEQFEGTITIDSPSVNAIIQGDSIITISGNATGNMELHGYTLEVKNIATGTIIYELEEHAHGESVAITGSFASNLTSETNLNLNVKLMYDHDDNYIEKNVQFVWKP